MFFEKSIVVLVQFPRKLSSFTGRTPETLRGSLSDHMVLTLVLAIPLLLGYTYFPYNLILKFLFSSLPLSFSLYSFPLPYFRILNGRPKTVYTQTSLSLV